MQGDRWVKAGIMRPILVPDEIRQNSLFYPIGREMKRTPKALINSTIASRQPLFADAQWPFAGTVGSPIRRFSRRASSLQEVIS